VLNKGPAKTLRTGLASVPDHVQRQRAEHRMAKPAPVRHLYEIHTVPQPPLVADVLSGDIVAELARLREFL
jgi:hypothetical protein